MAKKHQIITVEGEAITVKTIDEKDYISLTDMARQFNERPIIPIQSWLKNNSTLRFLALWEKMHNPNFKVTQMDDIKLEQA